MDIIQLGSWFPLVRPIYGTDMHLRYMTGQPRLMHHFYQSYYYWDCALGDQNPGIPQSLTFYPRIVVDELTPLGNPATGKHDARLQRLFDITDIGSEAELQASLERSLPPTTISILNIVARIPIDMTVKIDFVVLVRYAPFTL